MKTIKILTFTVIVICSGCNSMIDTPSSSWLDNYPSNPNPLTLNVGINPNFGILSSTNLPGPPADWKSRFVPLGGDMSTDEDDWGFSSDLRVSIEPILEFGDWHVGIPVSSNLSMLSQGEWFGKDKLIGSTTLDWWDNVTLMKTYLKRSPSIGVSFGNEYWFFEFSTHKYETYVEDYYGVDVWGGKNYSKFHSKRDLDDGWGQRLDLYKVSNRTDWHDRNKCAYNLFLEKDGDVWFVGVGLKLMFGVLGY
jgi:hypothetical protein